MPRKRPTPSGRRRATPAPSGVQARLAQLTKALETMQLGVTITDLQGRILFTNPAEAELHGYTVKELIGQDAIIFAPNQQRRPLSAQELKVMTSWTRESLNIRKDGSVFPVRLLSDVVRDPAGRPTGVITTCEDITERKRMEDAVRRSEARYRAIVERATYGIFRSGPGGNFTAVNPALVAMLGYDSAQDLLDADLATQVCGDPKQLPRLLDHFLHGIQPMPLELEWKRKDGLPLTVRLSGHAVRTASGSFDGFEMIVEDITERRALEEQLRQAQKMEVLGQLTGGIAHDFNNLLTVILANADILSASTSPELEQVRKDLKEVRLAAQRGAAMVRQLMAFSRYERLDFQPLNLAHLLDDQAEVLRRVVPAHTELRLVVKKEVPSVQADPSAVEQILLNLVTNARDAMPAGGVLRIQTNRVFLDQEFRAAHGWGEPGEYGLLSVSDTGMGMDAATLGKVFEPFFTTKPKGRGTGLGMAMVYSLVKQHRGFVTAYSELGEGTTVNVYLPALRVEGEAALPVPEAVLRGGTETILIAEDDPPIRRATKRALERFGYRTLVAADGAEALEAFRANQGEIALVVSDLVMPRLGGRELAQALSDHGSSVPVLFTSGYSATDVVESLGLDPRQPFLHKPWTLTDLVNRVREVLDGALPVQ